MARLPLIVVIGLSIAFAFVACSSGGGTGERTSWQTAFKPGGSEIHILVYVGPCDSFDSIAVQETGKDVTLKAYINRGTKQYCDGPFVFEAQKVRLDAPLGERELLGCNPPDAIYKRTDAFPFDCAGAAIS